MNETDKANRVVVLRFVDALRVDIVANMTEREAIADFAGRTLAGMGAPDLPLIEGITAAIPPDRLRALAGDGATVEPLPIARPSLPIAGAMHAVRAYMAALTKDRTGPAADEAKAAVIQFFDRYGIELDFTVAKTPLGDRPTL